MTDVQSINEGPIHSPEPSAGLARTLAGLALARGVLFILIGLTLMFWPKATVQVASVFIGVGLLISGITRFLGLFSISAEGWVKALEGMLGVLMVLTGVLCIRAPFASLLVLLVVVALGWLMDGIAAMVGAIHPFDGGRLLYAAISVVGAVAVLAWPGLALSTYVVLAAWFLLILGAVQLLMAWRARKA